MYRLEIGKPVPIHPGQLDTYVFEVKYMDGDADGYSTEEFSGSNPVRTQDILKFWITWKNLDWNYRCTLLANYPLLEAAVKDMDLTDPDDILDQLFVTDITCEGYYAHFESLKIYWYNDHGIKHNTHIIDEDDNVVHI